MLILAVDTSTPAVVAGICELTDATVRVLADRVTSDAMAHAEVLTPQITDCLAEAELTPADLDAVVVGRGPGPFTGLRVGMATASAFAHALGIPVLGVSGLDAVAARARRGGTPDGDLLVVTDARRREAYSARYDAPGTRLSGPAVGRAADIDTAGVALAVGDATRLDELADADADADAGRRRRMVRDSSVARPDPAALVEVAAAAGLAEVVSGERETDPPTPLYLRRPDAVEPRARLISPALVGRGPDSRDGPAS